MIITEEVKVKIRSNSLKYYTDLGYDVKPKDKIIIPVEHLTNGSHVKVEVECDVCGGKKEIEYREYLRSYNKYNSYACSQKCGSIKGKKTKLKKYGDENFNNRGQAKETCLEEYGVENVFQLEEIKEKSKQTNLKNLGVEFPTQSPEVREKTKQTNLKNFGVEWTTQSENMKNKSRKTCLERFGVEYSFQSPEVREKGNKTKLKKYDDENYHNVEQMKKTNLKNLGVEFPFQSEEILDKCKQTCLENNGVENPFQIPGIYNKIYESIYGISYEKYLGQLPDFKRYRNEVWKFTNKQRLNILKNYNKRGLRNYHLDHKFSIKEGFLNNIPPYIIGNICNLEMLIWEDNISKNYNCSITKEELFDLI